MKFFIYLLLFINLCSFRPVVGQVSKVDSLLTLLKTAKEDTNKVNYLNALSWELMYVNPDTAFKLSNQALEICKKIDNSYKVELLKSQSLKQIGVYYHLKADYPQALKYYFKALKIDNKLGNKNGIAKHLNNIEIVYKEQGDYPKALYYYFNALKRKEELGNKIEIAATLNNIGIVFWNKLIILRPSSIFLRHYG